MRNRFLTIPLRRWGLSRHLGSAVKWSTTFSWRATEGSLALTEIDVGYYHVRVVLANRDAPPARCITTPGEY
jgi:hypothetical protein